MQDTWEKRRKRIFEIIEVGTEYDASMIFSTPSASFSIWWPVWSTPLTSTGLPTAAS